MDNPQLDPQLADQIQAGNTGQILPTHTHNGVDSPVIDTTTFIPVNLAAQTGIVPVANGGTGLATLTSHYLLAGNGTSTPSLIAPGTSGQLLTSGGASSDPSFATYTPPTPTQIIVNVLAGEHLTAGEVVRVYDSSVEHGYGQTTSPATAYVARAAGTSSAFTNYVLGIALATTNYLSTCSVLVAGASTVQSGLAIGKNYLADYSTGSTETITQSSNAIEGYYDDTHPITQLWIPTQSFLNKVTFYMAFGGGAAPRLRVKRASTVLATDSAPTNVTNYYTFTLNIQTYKGEILQFVIDHQGTPGDHGSIYYQTGDPYAPVYDPTGSSASIDATGGVAPKALPASGADLYMKIYEHTGFGSLATTAGTRPVKIGNALSATSLALAIQEKDANL